MILELRRRVKTSTYTIGDLYIDGVLFCQTMEDTDRGLMFQMSLEEIKAKKVFGKTAIPTGVYEVVFSFSQKFQKMLPLVLNVPGYLGIRFHSGTTAEDTEGCVLSGIQKGEIIVDSRNTCKKLFSIMLTALKKEKIYLFVTNYDN